MGVLDQFKDLAFTVEKKVESKSRDFETLVADTISEQRRIAGGAQIPTKKNKDGEQQYKKSWRDEKTGVVDARIGVTPILGDQRYTMNKEQYGAFLDVLENNWQTDDELKKAFAECKVKKEEQEAKRKATMAKKKAEKEAAKLAAKG